LAEPLHFASQFYEGRDRCALLGGDHEVELGVIAQAPDCFSNSSLDPVAAGMAPNPPRGRNPHQTSPGEQVHPAKSAAHALSLFENLVEAALARAFYGANLARPLSRRRFNVFCPSVVPIRTRKPWVVFLWRLFGW
jgi:hypothetical protein